MQNLKRKFQNDLYYKMNFTVKGLKKIIAYAGFIVIPLKISFAFVKKKFCFGFNGLENCKGKVMLEISDL